MVRQKASCIRHKLGSPLLPGGEEGGYASDALCLMLECPG